MTENRGRFFYHFELDILRFAAFFMVYLSHALPTIPGSYVKLGLPYPILELTLGVVRGGPLGVDLFFVLSSYLITELLLREYDQRGSIDIKAFYVRRVLRIWPLYLFALFVGPPLLHWLDPAQQFGTAYLLGFLFFAGNWVCAFNDFPRSGLAPLWSVSVEEQFYLCWPWAVQRFRHQLHWVCTGLFGVAFSMRFWLVHIHATSQGIWCNTLARLDPIASGALLAIFLTRREIVFKRFSRLLFITTGFLLIVWVGLTGEGNGPRVLWNYPLGTIACVLLLIGVLRPSSATAAPPGRVASVFVYLGRISYGLYVFHVAVINIVQVPSSSPQRWAINIISSCALTLLLAALSYRYLETPFLRLKQRFSYISSIPG